MRKWLAVVGLVVVGGVVPGCSTPCASTGWVFQVGRPATFSTPGLVQQTSGPLAVSPLGSTLPPVIGDVAAQLGPSTLRPSVQPHILGRMRPAEECTMEDICLMLRRIESRLNQSGPTPRPLPQGTAPAPEQ